MTQTMSPVTERSVTIPAGRVSLPGTLALPLHPSALVIFAHGSGSSRLSPRNLVVAEELQAAGLATLLFDLLTERETEQRANVFDIPLLAERLLAATVWVQSQPEVADLPMGYFGASTGTAAALVAAARSPERIAAVVSRGGRPDLAGEYLPQVRAATLLIVGGRDQPVLGLNRLAMEKLGGQKRLVIVPGATHLFEEPGALEEVAGLAAGWLVQQLVFEAKCRDARTSRSAAAVPARKKPLTTWQYS